MTARPQPRQGERPLSAPVEELHGLTNRALELVDDAVTDLRIAATELSSGVVDTVLAQLAQGPRARTESATLVNLAARRLVVMAFPSVSPDQVASNGSGTTSAAHDFTGHITNVIERSIASLARLSGGMDLVDIDLAASLLRVSPQEDDQEDASRRDVAWTLIMLTSGRRLQGSRRQH